MFFVVNEIVFPLTEIKSNMKLLYFYICLKDFLNLTLCVTLRLLCVTFAEKLLHY